MGLLNKAADAATAPGFEDESENTATASAKSEKEKTVTTAPDTAAKSTSTAVAVKPANALATDIANNLKAMESFKDALPVEYNTLVQITAQQGNLMDRESKKILGDTVVFELLSYQDSYVVSPENDDAPDDTVRYSNDGVHCTDGTLVDEHLEWLKANGFPKARLKQRVIVVGAIQSAAKTEEYNGTLVQFDVSPASRVQWNRYLANAAYGLKVGKFAADKVNVVKVETTLAQGGGNNTFTLMKFSVNG